MNAELKTKVGKGWEDQVKIITKTIPYSKVEGTELLESSRYDIFIKDIKNRPISEDKVHHFMKQFKQEKCFMYEFPIVVDKGYIILDGQHRFEALKRLEMPIMFRFSSGLNIDNVASIQVNAGWSSDDYIHAHIKQGKQDYVVLKRFMDRYKISLSVAIAILSGKFSRDNGGLKKSGFYEGTFTVVNEERAHKQAKVINELGELSFGLNRDRTFCLAVVRMQSHPEYDNKRMVNQLEKYNSLVKRHMKIDDYLRNLEEVYNYKLFTKNKVRFL